MGDVKVDLQEVKEESDSGPAPQPPAPLRRVRWTVAAVVLVLVAVGSGAWLLRTRTRAEPMRVVPLTQMTGHAMWPTFSPDGQQVAFAWQPEGADNFDIYVKLVGLEEVRRLTTDPSNDRYPSWSPDGRQIAFVRDGSKGSTIRLVSPIGGAERRLSDFPVVGTQIAWSPDGRYLAASLGQAGTAVPEIRIYLLPVDGGHPRPITPLGSNYLNPSFTRDGRRLAYVSCKGGGENCALKCLDLDPDFTPRGNAHLLTRLLPFLIWGTTWSRDGRSVIYGAMDAGATAVWRVSVDDDKPPERIELAGSAAAWPAIAPSGDRLAFTRDDGAHAPYRFESDQPSQPLLTSSLFGGGLDISPDSRRIAYCANSGADMEVWTANTDGSAPQQLTHGPGHWQCSPRWSPDGERIAFDSEGADGLWHIWSTPADGGMAHQITREEGSQNVPSWSRDGQWIYYSANLDIWRIHLGDEQRQRLTSESGALTGLEAGDGTSLLYADGRGALLAVPLAGGPPRQIAPCVRGWAVARMSRGIYYTPCVAETGWGGTNPALHVVNPSTGEDRVLGALDKFSTAGVFGLAVSPYRKVIVL